MYTSENSEILKFGRLSKPLAHDFTIYFVA